VSYHIELVYNDSKHAPPLGRTPPPFPSHALFGGMPLFFVVVVDNRNKTVAVKRLDTSVADN